jgi:transketolase
MNLNSKANLESLAKLVRYYILLCTSAAGSGHPTSSLSAADMGVALMFGGFFRYDPKNPSAPGNDRFVLSKGHATPLFYSLWAAAGEITEDDLRQYRKFGNELEGHPTPNFRFAEAATGSLGQGLSIGVGLALNGKYLDEIPYRTFVLLGDSEMVEGSNWEAIQIAAHYRLDNLIAIVDVNRLGQRGETMYGWSTETYEKRFAAFGWDTAVIDGHDFDSITPALEKALEAKDKPFAIIARTVKGKGVPAVENKNGWHGKALNKDDVEEAMGLMDPIDTAARGHIAPPVRAMAKTQEPVKVDGPNYTIGEQVATRKAYGDALKRLYPAIPHMVVLDGEVNNSTYAEIFAETYGSHYFEMYVGEQNMAGAAVGLSARGKLPFVSTFAAFFTRAFDQIRMSQYSRSTIVFCGSHAGVSIGEDGPSQMGLEDIAMFRSITGSVVFYPCDALSTEKAVEEAAGHRGISYIRTTRSATPVIYDGAEEFPIGGNKVLRKSERDRLAVVAAGITVFEALNAYEELKAEGISIRVIDLYCLKPIDKDSLKRSLGEIPNVVTVEDHHPEGGIGEAVRSVLAGDKVSVYSLAVKKIPRSGKSAELLEFEGISKAAIVKMVKELL